MKKILFWERKEKSPYDGYCRGDIIPANEVEQAISLFEFPIIVWENIPGEKADELNERLPDLEDLSEDEIGKVVNKIVGSEGKRPYGIDDVYPVSDCLAFDLGEGCFFDLGIIPSFPAYGYVRDSNWTYAVFDEDCMTQYEFLVVDSYVLDYQEKPGRTDFTYGGLGHHAWLEKVRDEETGECFLLLHFWSQWAGEELDYGYLLTEEEALQELSEHPEIEKIRVWLKRRVVP